jgi:hypothetical protein
MSDHHKHPDSEASALRKSRGVVGPRCPGHVARPLGGILLYAAVLGRHLKAKAQPAGPYSSASIISGELGLEKRQKGIFGGYSKPGYVGGLHMRRLLSSGNKGTYGGLPHQLF